MKMSVRSIHKYASLALALFWFLQALTGLLLVFQYELDDARIGGQQAAFDPAAFDRGVADILAANPGKTIPYIYTAGAGDRFDIFLADANGATDTLRVDGDGTLLRTIPADSGIFESPIFQTAIDWHKNLFAGDIGHILVGISGLFLLTNIILGLKLAWPRARQWRQAFSPLKARGTAASRYAWHRALGLGLAVPAFVLVAAGTSMVWEDWIGEKIGAGTSTPAPEISDANGGPTLIAMKDAIRIATDHYPGARISIIYPPRDTAPWYRFRLLQEDESRRLFGTTTLYVDAADGRVLANYDALKATASDRIIKGFYTIHTGDLLGTFGRVLVFITGLWLLAMVTLGVLLWQARRRRSGKTA